MQRKLLYILSILFSGVYLHAQLFAPDANHAIITDYGNDTVYIFGAEEYGDTINASLQAYSQDDNSAIFNFEWFVYDTATLNFNTIRTESDTISIFNIDEPGYYQLIMDDGEADTFKCWVLFYDYNIEITSKDENDSLLLTYKDCGDFRIYATVTNETELKYYSPDSALIEYSINFEKTESWNILLSEAEDSRPQNNFSSHPYYYYIVNNPYYEDTEYNLTFNSFGIERTDNVIYGSIEPYADIDHEFIYLDDLSYYPEEYDTYYNRDKYIYQSAPAKFIFNNQSKNADTYIWEFGDSSRATITYEADGSLIHDYMLPGTYYFQLTAQKHFYSAICIDKLDIPIAIIVEKSQLKDSLPNVITPNNDGFNDYFRTKDISIGYIDIKIMNRYGKVVHKYKGNIRDWIGWYGTVLNSDRLVLPGVYYYAIKMIETLKDWETQETEKFGKELHYGFIHVFY